MSKKVNFLILAMGTLALSSCGKNDFNGRYTGYETVTPNAQNSQLGYNSYMYGVGNQSYPVTLELREDDDQVRGSYRLHDGSTGDFRASASGADKLNNIRLTITQMGTGQVQGGNMPQWNTLPSVSMSYCNLYTGELKASNNGRRIEGTLVSQTTQQGQSQFYTGFAAPCTNKQITLDRD